MSAIITNKFRIFQAEQLKSILGDVENKLYLAISRSSPWPKDAITGTELISVPVDSSPQETEDLRQLLAAKRISTSDASYVIPRIDWTKEKASNPNIVFDEYDDQDPNLFTKKFYVINDYLQVWKCISNNYGAISTEQPVAINSVPGIITTSDGYKWKYMFRVPAADSTKFLNEDWIPVRVLSENDNSGSDQWEIQTSIAVPGTIDLIKITTGGSGYASTPTVTITGDGSGATATATVVGGVVTAINIVTPGSGYTYATATLSGGSPAVAGTLRPIISPIKGHGTSVAEELGATYLMLSVLLSYDESGDFTTENDFRKILILRNPFLFGTTTLATAGTYDCTTKLYFGGLGGTDGSFQKDDIIQQSTTGATARVVSIATKDTNVAPIGSTLVLTVSDVKGTFSGAHNAVLTFREGNVLPQTPNVQATGLVAVINPELDLYSGDVIYKDYRFAVQRSSDQRELVSIVIEY